MKKIYLLLSSLLCLGALNAQTFTSNFANWNAGDPTDFMGTRTNLSSDSINQVTGGNYGPFACQLSNATGTGKRFSTQPVSVTNGTTYEIKFWAKGQGDIATRIWAGSYVGGVSYTSINSSTWNMYTTNVTSDSTIATAEFLFYVRNTVKAMGDIQLDSVYIAPVSVPSASIQSIQTPNAGGDTSQYIGQTFVTGGIVTAVKAGTGYWIQAGTGPYSGIYVFDGTNSPARGDSVTLTGTVDEYFSATQLTNIANFNIVSSGNTVNPMQLSTLNVNDEQYEGCLVNVTNAQCTNPSLGFGEWELNDGSGALIADDFLYAYTANLNDVYNVTGVTTFSFGNYKILPRDANDIANITGIDNYELSNFLISPNPANDVLSITSANTGNWNVSLMNLQGQVIENYHLNNKLTIDVSDLSKGIYLIKLTNNETVKTFKVLVE